VQRCLTDVVMQEATYVRPGLAADQLLPFYPSSFVVSLQPPGSWFLKGALLEIFYRNLSACIANLPGYIQTATHKHSVVQASSMKILSAEFQIVFCSWLTLVPMGMPVKLLTFQPSVGAQISGSVMYMTIDRSNCKERGTYLFILACCRIHSAENLDASPCNSGSCSSKGLATINSFF
jgi:hypothetical protein